MKKTLTIAMAALLAVSCGRGKQTETDTTATTAAVEHRGVYHWKTTYDPNEWETDWMKRHHVDRLYVKLFEVDAGSKHGYDDWRMVPVATTRFEQPLSKGMEVVPVVYITVDAIRAMSGSSYETMERLAKLLVERVYAMTAEHWGGEVKEVQLDCDWTTSTRYDFFRLCRRVEDCLNKRGAILSGTVRLHQLKDEEIPFDRKLLMCYNTGRLQDSKTHNSILDYDDVKPYLRGVDSSTLRDYDIAWPTYGWGVQFDAEGHFSHLTKPADSANRRIEWGEPKEVRRVKKHLPQMRDNTVVLYHLDEENLKHYNDEEIEEMYGPRPAAR